MKKILNDLWSQRMYNVWLFAELIVVCFVAWTQLDPIIVRLYYRSLPSGIDGDRLVVANILSTKPYEKAEEGMTQKDYEEIYERQEEQYQQEANVIKRQLLALDGVEQASIADPVMGVLARTDLLGGSWLSSLVRYTWQNDTVSVHDICYSKDEHFFETYGIQPIVGCATSKELSDFDHGWIVSRSLAERLFGSAEAAMKKELVFASFVGREWRMPIVAVVNDVHVSEKDYNTWMVYHNNGEIRSGGSQDLIVLRLKPGVNARRFAEQQNFHPWKYAANHFAVASFTAYNDIGSSKNLFAMPTLTYDFNLSVATAVFFLINLCLGVIGTFWMQTKRRTEESGIMRAFGATKRRVMAMFLAEGWVLATISMLIACVLYLNYIKAGLGVLCINAHEPGMQPDPTWVANKPLHFLIVSAIVYLIILCTVLIGTAIPAWRICRTGIIESIREE